MLLYNIATDQQKPSTKGFYIFRNADLIRSKKIKSLLSKNKLVITGIDNTTGDYFSIFKLSAIRYLLVRSFMLKDFKVNKLMDISFKKFYPLGHRYSIIDAFSDSAPLWPYFTEIKGNGVNK